MGTTADRTQGMLRNMVESRCLDERMLLLVRRGLAPFWTGGPGEEVFNTCLGALLDVGQGPDHDFLLPHYRSSAIALMAGETTLDFLRQLLGRDTDPFSRGRNFANHFANAARNLGPVSSPVNSQFVFALGTARAQKAHRGITVVVGGDASTHQGDFASLLSWATRPGDPLPVLIVVTNNSIGISTTYASQHSETQVAARAAPFGIPAAVVDGTSLQQSLEALETAFAHVRATRSPYLLEAMVPRLWGHSSSSSSTVDAGVQDPLQALRLPAVWWEETRARLAAEEQQVLLEPAVDGASAQFHQEGPARPWPPLPRP